MQIATHKVVLTITLCLAEAQVNSFLSSLVISTLNYSEGWVSNCCRHWGSSCSHRESHVMTEKKKKKHTLNVFVVVLWVSSGVLFCFQFCQLRFVQINNDLNVGVDH